ncbi:MAG: hypothetical protein VB092_06845 [Oscillospiraceae bacterium]|nr:hypothetical protein [Oscillospiraceae bacterium]
MSDTPATKKERQKRRQRRRRQFVGLFVLILCVVGAATIIVGGVRLAKHYFSEEENYGDYEQLIAPIVSLDPAPFSSIDKADKNMLLEAAIWAALDYEDTSKYQLDEYGAILLPAIDVDTYITKMFGPSFKLEHQTFSDLDLEYKYDASSGCYTIPVTSQSGSYTPKVENITTSGNTKVLTVAYLQNQGSAADTVASGSDVQTTAKTMEYVMLKDTNGYYLYAIRYPEQTQAK